jgi:hypothetical protein
MSFSCRVHPGALCTGCADCLFPDYDEDEEVNEDEPLGEDDEEEA